jgi:Leucine-rich repeat (LRR) protein
LDLSHNLLIAAPPGLIHLHNLHHLNLSYNMISSVQAIYQILGNIAVLDLRGNRLESLCGLERLWNLEKIDVRDNNLDEAAEVGRLAALPGIREVWCEKNPFCAFQVKYAQSASLSLFCCTGVHCMHNKRKTKKKVAVANACMNFAVDPLFL